MFTENLLATVLSVFIAILAVVIIISFGWFFVWKMFLIRFSFIRELVYGGSNGSAGKTKSDVPPTSPRRSSRIRELRARKS
ncbi:Small integral membrane protein 13 [Stylophora pistillata]|uniref:Small integral membrane protein 13 n=1 Tax=Stylophora pistillata TaxID=50429 RepID=A0A2B4RZR8_STYPI|nr:Small integral membrane protein 13 [Stylophora pistillata]